MKEGAGPLMQDMLGESQTGLASISWSPTLTVLTLNLNNLNQKADFFGENLHCTGYSKPTHRERMDFESRKGSFKRSSCRAWGLGSQGLVSDSYQRTSRSERTWLAAPSLEWNEDRVPSGAAAFPLHSSGNWIWRQLAWNWLQSNSSQEPYQEGQCDTGRGCEHHIPRDHE